MRLPPAAWSLGLTEVERHRSIMVEFCERCGAMPGDPCTTSGNPTQTHQDRLDAAIQRFRQAVPS